MKKKSLAFAILLTFFTTLMLIACSFDASQPSHTPTLGALAPIAWGPDLDGSYASQKVVGIQGNPLAPPPADEGGVAIEWDGSSLYWGTAGGSVTPGDAGQFYVTNDAGAMTWVYPHGDVDASAADPGDLTVNAIQGYGVSASVPTAGNTLRWSGSLWGPAALNLAGGSGYVTGTLPTANQASQTLGGELSGTTAAAVVAGPFSTAALSWSSSTSAASLGTNKSGATLDLQADAAQTFMRLANTGGHATLHLWDGGSDTGATIETIASSTTDITGPTSGIVRIFNNPVGQSSLSLQTTEVVLTQPQSGFGLNFLDNGGINLAVLKQNGSTTTTLFQSGPTITSMTVNTNDTGAALQLGGDAAANVIKLTTAAEMQTQVVYDAVSSPSVPSATQITVYVDTLDNKLKAKDNAGNVTVLAP